MEDQLQLIFDAVVYGEMETAEKTVQDAIKLDISANNIIKGAFIPAMAKGGNLFEEGDFNSENVDICSCYESRFDNSKTIAH